MPWAYADARFLSDPRTPPIDGLIGIVSSPASISAAAWRAYVDNDVWQESQNPPVAPPILGPGAWSRLLATFHEARLLRYLRFGCSIVPISDNLPRCKTGRHEGDALLWIGRGPVQAQRVYVRLQTVQGGLATTTANVVPVPGQNAVRIVVDLSSSAEGTSQETPAGVRQAIAADPTSASYIAMIVAENEANLIQPSADTELLTPVCCASGLRQPGTASCLVGTAGVKPPPPGTCRSEPSRLLFWNFDSAHHKQCADRLQNPHPNFPLLCFEADHAFGQDYISTILDQPRWLTNSAEDKDPTYNVALQESIKRNYFLPSTVRATPPIVDVA